MKKSVLMAIMLFVGMVFPAAAQNLLKNPAFVNKLAHWTVRGGKADAKDGVLILRGGRKMFVVHYKLPLSAGKYRASYQVSGSGQYRAYCEWNGNVNGKKFYRSSGAKVINAPGKKERRTFEFTLTPADVAKAKSFAFVIGYENGEVEISAPELVKVDTPAVEGSELLKNRNFARNFGYWTVRGTAPERDNGTLGFSNGKRTFVVQYKLPVAAGKYRASYQVSGSGKYRVYCEYHGSADGKKFYRAPGAGVLTAPEQSAQRSFEFEIAPEDVSKVKSFAFVIRYDSGIVNISEPSLVKIAAAPAKAALPKSANESVLGGKWTFANNSFLSGSGSSLELHQYGHSHIRRTRLSGIPVTGGATYRFSCQVNGIATADERGGFCAFRIVPVAGKKELLVPKWEDTLLSNKQFKHLEFTVPAGAEKLELQFETPAKTVVGFSAFELKTIPPQVAKSSFYLTEPAYRDMVFASHPVKNISGRAVLRGQAVGAVAKLSVNGKNIAVQTVKNDGSFSFASPGRDCLVALEFTGKEGKIVSTARREVKFLAPNEVEVTVDSQNHLLVNGKRFFPVCFWELTAVNEPDGLYFAARNGVNCFLLTERYAKTPAEKKAILDTAHRYGMKVFLAVPSIDHLTADKMAAYRQQLEQVITPELKSHPAVIGYFLTDEAMWRGVPQQRVVNGYKLLKEFDPYRIIWVNAAPRNTVEAHASYAEGADIYGIDIYPYPYPHNQSGMEDKTLTCVGKYTDFCREAVDDRKPVWMALQGFSWRAYYHPDDGRDYPGLNQMRFVTYETLFYGGRAGTIWGTRHIRAAAYYDTLFDLSYEMYLVSGLFSRCERIEKVKSTNDKVIAELMYVDGKTYLTVRNCDEKPHISWVYGKFPAMKQLLPAARRQFPANDAQVALEPFEVQIFGTDALPEPTYQLPEVNAEFEKMPHPFKRLVKSDVFKRRYDGKAYWIWDDEAFAANAAAEVSRTFELDPAKVKSITIYAAADDAGKLYFNGNLLGAMEHFSNMQTFDVPQNLWRKQNTVTVNAVDSGMLPCGVLAEIKITFTDGTVQSIVSDRSWQCRGKAVREVAPFGKGAWGRRVSIELKR
ncbi:MAG: hypothetical protein E7041_03130 [Lentisphaerae bacterium]|nr:hypothetical protein [Lentisphaerota bacterium]